jgi:hypothetical protein
MYVQVKMQIFSHSTIYLKLRLFSTFVFQKVKLTSAILDIDAKSHDLEKETPQQILP